MGSSVLISAQRKDANTTPTTADGEIHTVLTDANGNLKVNVVAGSAGGVSASDGAAYTAGSTSGAPIMGAVDDTGTTAASEDTVGIARITAQRGVHVNLRNVSGTEIGTATTPARIDPTGTTAQPVTDNSGSLTVDYATTGSGTATGALRVELPTNGTGVVGLNAGTNSIGKLGSNSGVTIGAVEVATAQTLATVTTVGTVTSITNQVDTNLKQVGGTNTVTAGVAGTLAVGGNVATNVAIGTNPINVGAQAVNAENTAVTTARMVQLVADLVGKQIILPYTNPENILNGSASTTGTGDTTVISAQAGSNRIYVTSISIANTSANNVLITVKDGAAGGTLWQTIAPANGGSNITFPVPLRGTAATLLAMAAGTASTTIYFSAQGYKGV